MDVSCRPIVVDVSLEYESFLNDSEQERTSSTMYNNVYLLRTLGNVLAGQSARQ
jgi:hypothetical protein